MMSDGLTELETCANNSSYAAGLRRAQDRGGPNMNNRLSAVGGRSQRIVVLHPYGAQLSALLWLQPTAIAANAQGKAPMLV
jgi:hypothetical protein